MNFLWQASVYLENLAGSVCVGEGEGEGDGRRRREEEEEEEEKSEGEDGREGFGEECSTTRRIPAPRNVQSQPSIPDPSTPTAPIPIEAKSRSTDAPDAHTSRLPDVTGREPTDEAATTRLTRHEIKKKRKVVVRQQPVLHHSTAEVLQIRLRSRALMASEMTPGPLKEELGLYACFHATVEHECNFERAQFAPAKQQVLLQCQY
ncbi:hypothetical protein NP233_g10227 [Leucocoprinus birnbaumii]|uniref:Uncharacterized protein n=1 Tax=Leucocoprinus birnbaumii TaxID=56174 RepID=A0AAD5VIM8_9AGAR|nr:hypothetical protein NP233_g10227 [Leucocoprinus birnbaumii]